MDDSSAVDQEILKSLNKVKQFVRNDWVDSENKLFINKLNSICSNYNSDRQEVSNRLN